MRGKTVCLEIRDDELDMLVTALDNYIEDREELIALEGGVETEYLEEEKAAAERLIDRIHGNNEEKNDG